ncbi:hypothetical protein KI387_019974, partial [Taxus chinensis]
LVSLVIGDVGVVLVYIHLKPNLENKKYVENEFTYPEPPKGKHTIENVPTPQLVETVLVDEEEKKQEDSVGLEHRGR